MTNVPAEAIPTKATWERFNTIFELMEVGSKIGLGTIKMMKHINLIYTESLARNGKRTFS